jgi:hypothetical protein
MKLRKNDEIFGKRIHEKQGTSPTSRNLCDLKSITFPPIG